MIGSDIHYAAELLKKGEVVAIPTETVYGLAGNAFDKNAVAKIFEVKNRPAFNPLIVHIKNVDFIHKIAKNIDNRLMFLLQKFSPGPITVLVDKQNNIPDIVTAGSKKVAVRIPSHPVAQKLLQLLDFPLAAPSANPFQYISPTTAQQVEEQIGDKIPYILDGGKCAVGIESTIVGVENNQIIVYRLGGLEVEAIENTVGKVFIKTEFKEDEHVQTSGQLKKHYSPHKKLVVGNIEQLVKKYANKKMIVITFGTKTIPLPETAVEYNLSPTGNIREAAANLFEVLYKADHSDADVIIASFFPNEGLGKAINDRLRRSANE